MHYETGENLHGLKHDPFKSLVVPRPIGWVGTVDGNGVANLAPYSFFNVVSDRPPFLMFSSAGRKDTLINILETGEFTCSLATWELREAMNKTSASVARNVDEFDVAGLTAAASRFVRPPRVGESPAAFECRLWKTVELPGPLRGPNYTMVFGEVVGVYIDDEYVRDGIVDVGAMRPVARLGYMDYAVVNADAIFSLNRPLVGDDGRTVTVPKGDWDGVYR